MKIIISEDQHDRVVSTQSRNWVRRNYEFVKEGLKDTFNLTKDDICRYDNYEDFEYYFFSVLMDCLHQYYMDIENHNYHIYLGIEPELIDLFYVECTEFYFAGRERCR